MHERLAEKQAQEGELTMRSGKDVTISDANDLFQVRLSQVMAHDGIDKKHLAERLGITYQAVSQFLSGKAKPTLQTAVKIAKALDVSLDWLCGLVD